MMRGGGVSGGARWIWEWECGGYATGMNIRQQRKGSSLPCNWTGLFPAQHDIGSTGVREPGTKNREKWIYGNC